MSRARTLLGLVAATALTALSLPVGDAAGHGPPPLLGPFVAPVAPPSLGPGTVAGDWCGEETGRDDVAHETGDRGAPKIKVIEAVPSDAQPSESLRDRIQLVMKQAIEHVAAESGGRKSLRVDFGTSCGPEYVDILTLRLPQAASAYEGACNVGSQLFADAEAVLDAIGEKRNLTIFAPDVDCAYAAGYGNFPADDQPGPRNRANEGGQMAVDFTVSVDTALHEMFHNLGAVSRSAPHTDGTAHCWDLDDVMCYPYTGFAPKSPARPCDFRSPQPTDCNRDDYFDVAPAPGSFLATHWNTYDNVFLCPAAECLPTEPAPAVPDELPVTPKRESDAPAPPVAPAPEPAPQPVAAPAEQSSTVVAPAPPRAAKPKPKARKTRAKKRRACPKPRRGKARRPARCRAVRSRRPR